MKKLYLLFGYPGAGKTSTAKVLERLTSGQRFSSDEWRLKMFPMPTFSHSEHDQLYKALDGALAKAMMRGITPLIYDANLNRVRHRREKYHLAQQYGYHTVLIWVQTPKELAKQRRIDEAHHHHLVPSHEEPAKMFDRIVGIFEEPWPDEPYVAIDGRQVNDSSVAQLLH